MMEMDQRQQEPFLTDDADNEGVETVNANSLRIIIDRPVYDKRRLDDEFKQPDVSDTTVTWRENLKQFCGRKCHGACAPKSLLGGILRLFPFVETLRTYKWRKDIGMDALAGISVGMVHLPQGMGFALLAAVAPVYGLYASFWQVLMYALLGHCRHLSIGTMAVISLIIGAVVEREVVYWKATASSGMTPLGPFTTEAVTYLEYTSSGGLVELNISATPLDTEVEGLTEEDRFRASVACGVSLIAGATMFFMGVLRLGVITTFMPTSFVGGFTTGAAFHILTTQLKPLLNVQVKRHGGVFNLPKSIFEIIKAVPKTSIPDFIITLITFSFLVFIKEFVNVRYKKKLKIPIPAEVIVVIVATALSFGVGFHPRWGVKVIGFIPPGIPGPVMPNMERASTFAIDGIIAGITSFAISISMVDILTTKHKYKVSPNRELVAYGLTYGLSSFLHCFVGAAAPPRCFVMEMTGGKTQMASVFTSLLLLLVLLVVAPVFRYLPNASLACIIVVALFPLFKQFAVLPRLWRISRPDFAIWVVTWFVSVFIDVSISLGVGIFVAIMCSVLPSMSSKGYTYDETSHVDLSAPLQTHTKLSPRKNVIVFRYESTLYFVTIKNFKKELYKASFDPCNSQSANQEVNDQKDGVELGAMEEAETNTQSLKETHQSGITGIVLDCSPICYIDLMGLDTLKQLRNDYESVGVQFVLANCNPNLITKLEQAGMLDSNETSMHIFPTTQDAIVSLSPDMVNSNVPKMHNLPSEE